MSKQMSLDQVYELKLDDFKRKKKGKAENL